MRKEGIMKNYSISKARFLAVTAIMASIATILRFLDFGLPFLPSFLKFDFSLTPALISTYALGPLSGFLVVAFTETVALSTTVSSGVGELCNIILGSILVVSAGLIYHRKTTLFGAIIGSLVGTICMASMSMLTNYFITYPVYYNFIPKQVILGMYNAILPAVGDNLWKALAIFNLPLTLCKGLLSSVITFLLYKRLSPIIKGYNNKSKIVCAPSQNGQYTCELKGGNLGQSPANDIGHSVENECENKTNSNLENNVDCPNANNKSNN